MSGRAPFGVRAGRRDTNGWAAEWVAAAAHLNKSIGYDYSLSRDGRRVRDQVRGRVAPPRGWTRGGCGCRLRMAIGDGVRRIDSSHARATLPSRTKCGIGSFRTCIEGCEIVRECIAKMICALCSGVFFCAYVYCRCGACLESFDIECFPLINITYFRCLVRIEGEAHLPACCLVYILIDIEGCEIVRK